MEVFWQGVYVCVRWVRETRGVQVRGHETWVLTPGVGHLRSCQHGEKREADSGHTHEYWGKHVAFVPWACVDSTWKSTAASAPVTAMNLAEVEGISAALAQGRISKGEEPWHKQTGGKREGEEGKGKPSTAGSLGCDAGYM